MTDLSPQAQAVLDAFDIASDRHYDDGVWVPHSREQLAAALEAAAEHVVYNRVACMELRLVAAELRGTTEDNQ